MVIFLFVLLILLIIFGNIFLYGAIIYNKFQQLIIRIDEVESLIDNAIRDKFDLINKSIGIIKANSKIKEDLFPEIVKLRSRKLSSFELDRKLVESINQFYKIKDEYEELRQSDAFIEIINDLDEVIENLETYKKYYDENVVKYNLLVRKVPSNLIAKVFKYKEKEFVDKKDDDDDDKIDL